ncbi:MAG: hypothetical protein K1X54_05995 [Flavobacteriales bacterium]|nr:hypothetical protein [Flavobacteriales bacterium]
MSIFRSRSFLIGALATGMAALIVHFVIILGYSFRDQLPASATKLTDRYAVPMFHQNWKLFAPDLPRYNAELEYRYFGNQTWSDWSDITKQCGFGPYTRMETIEQGFNTQLSWQVVNNYYALNGRAQFDRMVQSPAYANCLFYVLKMHELYVSKTKPDSVQIRLNFRFTPPPQQAHTYQISNLEFPVYVPI